MAPTPRTPWNNKRSTTEHVLDNLCCRGGVRTGDIFDEARNASSSEPRHVSSWRRAIIIHSFAPPPHPPSHPMAAARGGKPKNETANRPGDNRGPRKKRRPDATIPLETEKKKVGGGPVIPQPPGDPLTTH